MQEELRGRDPPLGAPAEKEQRLKPHDARHPARPPDPGAGRCRLRPGLHLGARQALLALPNSTVSEQTVAAASEQLGAAVILKPEVADAADARVGSAEKEQEFQVTAVVPLSRRRQSSSRRPRQWRVLR